MIKELHSLLRGCFDQWHVFDPLREFVDYHEDELEVAGGRLKWPDHVEAPAGKGQDDRIV